MNFPVVEQQGQLKTSGSVVLSATGSGTITLSPTSASMRWLVTAVGVSTNQDATATVVPVAELALNATGKTTMSSGNSFGASWSGNRDSFSGQMDVGPCDFLAVLFYPAPGSTPAQIAELVGVIASAVVTGTRYTRRA